MARTRSPLSEKQERILVQCQLMGLTTRDMTQISNRLRVLDREREFKVEVDEVLSGMSWKKRSRNSYFITGDDGRTYDCIMTKKDGYYSWDKKEVWTIRINHPGTKVKERIITDQILYVSTDEVSSICPENDKRLFRLLRAVKKGAFKK